VICLTEYLVRYIFGDFKGYSESEMLITTTDSAEEVLKLAIEILDEKLERLPDLLDPYYLNVTVRVNVPILAHFHGKDKLGNLKRK